MGAKLKVNLATPDNGKYIRRRAGECHARKYQGVSRPTKSNFTLMINCVDLEQRMMGWRSAIRSWRGEH
jgi:hypothetical protein